MFAASPTDLSQVHRVARRWLIGAAVISLTAFIAGLVGSGTPPAAFFDSVHWTVSSLAASVVAWLGVRSAQPEDRAPRRWFAWGLTLDLAAQLLWDLWKITGFAALYHLPDPFFVAIGPCFVIGLIAATRKYALLQNRLFLLDVTALVLVASTLTLDLYLPVRSAMDTWGFVTSLISPLSLLMVGCVGAVFAPTVRLPIDHRWMLLLAAAVCNGMVWMVWNVDVDPVVTPLDTAVAFAFSIVNLGMGWGVLIWHTEPNLAPGWQRRCEAMLRFIPLLVVAAAVISAASVWATPGMLKSVQLATFVGAIIVIALAAARQNLSLLEHDRLVEAERHLSDRTRELQASNASLAAINQQLTAATRARERDDAHRAVGERSEERLSRQHEP